MITSSPDSIASYTRAGWWGQETLYDLLEARARVQPDAEALIDPADRMDLLGDAPQRLRYGELLARVQRLAARLEAIGVGRDKVIVAQLPNVHEMALLILAASRLGAVVSPMALQYRASEIGWVVARTRARAFVTVTRCRGFDHAAYARAHLPPEVAVYTIGEDAPAGVLRLGDAQGPIRTPRATANDIVTICWTSGTEGRPKGVPRSSNHWIAGARAKALPDPDEVYLCTFPLVAAGSIGGQLVPWLVSGGTFVLHHPFDLPLFVEQIRAERVSYTSAPPAILLRLLASADLLQQADLSSLRAIGSGSAPLAPTMLEAFHDRFGIEVINNFGSNEGCILFSTEQEIADPALRATHFPASSRQPGGAAYAGGVIETRLLDPDGSGDVEVAGRPGGLLIRGPTVFDGYWSEAGLDRSSFDAEDYFHTGDLLELVDAGAAGMLYRFVGRSKELIVRGGMKIAPAELEEHLVAMPGIKEVACVGYSDPVLGERVAAVVVPNAGETVTLERLLGFLRTRELAVYKLPERLYLADSLPRNPTNKVIRSELRNQLGIT